jgi:uncharacterized membrane protein YkoI
MNVRTLPVRRTLAGLSLVACGLVAGGTLAAVGTANAADSVTSTTSSSSTSNTTETALTGDVLAKVKAAVLAKYAGATFTRVETDNGGVYEAHIVTGAGQQLTVALDKAYAITGTETGGGRGHGGKGHGGGAGETALTGDVLAKVKAAVLAKYAGATFTRVETDNGGVYEAHIVTAAGQQLTVALDKAYAITGTE